VVHVRYTEYRTARAGACQIHRVPHREGRGMSDTPSTAPRGQGHVRYTEYRTARAGACQIRVPQRGACQIHTVPTWRGCCPRLEWSPRGVASQQQADSSYSSQLWHPSASCGEDPLHDLEMHSRPRTKMNRSTSAPHQFEPHHVTSVGLSKYAS
jgi:hypothetical protein